MKLFALVLAVALMTGCSGTRAVYQQADTPVEYAKAVLLHHNALGLEAVRIVNDPTVSERVKSEVRAAYRATVCGGGEAVGVVAVADCTEGPAYRLDRAIQNYELLSDPDNRTALNRAVQSIVPLVTALLRAVNSSN